MCNTFGLNKKGILREKLDADAVVFDIERLRVQHSLLNPEPLNPCIKKGGIEMALFRTVSPQEATGKVKEVYEDIKETKKIDFIPNFWQALSNNPDHLEATWQKLKTVMKPGKLDLLTKEIIALAVSVTNNCTY